MSFPCAAHTLILCLVSGARCGLVDETMKLIWLCYTWLVFTSSLRCCNLPNYVRVVWIGIESCLWNVAMIEYWFFCYVILNILAPGLAVVSL